MNMNMVAEALLFLILAGGMAMAADERALRQPRVMKPRGHPRLYFDAGELKKLRSLRNKGVHKRIYDNLIASADWCLTLKPRTEWIAPKSPDPIHENLYDRFYAMMQDMSVMEHLAFAYAYSGKDKYFLGARQWALASVRIWSNEARGEPNASKAYAVMRLMKGVAIAYDLIYDGLTAAERKEIRDKLVAIGQPYHERYWSKHYGGPGHGLHHGTVEAASFGVAGLALLEDVPEAKAWVDRMVYKMESHLLPKGLAADGQQTEGSSFYASTMQYRIAFMDALRRVTGKDLFKPYAGKMSGNLALAEVAGPKRDGYNEVNQSTLFQPSYAQLDYFSPVLVFLAREYRRPTYQHLALWDPALGAIQRTRYRTPNMHQELLFEWGGCTYAWYDPTVPAEVKEDEPLSFDFPSVNEAVMRDSYQKGAIVAGMKGEQVLVHAGGRIVLQDRSSGLGRKLTDNGTTAAISFANNVLELKRPARLTYAREASAQVEWICHGLPKKTDNTLTWPDGTTLEITQGTLGELDASAAPGKVIVGMGKLDLSSQDPHPVSYLRIRVQPKDGKVSVEVRTPAK